MPLWEDTSGKTIYGCRDKTVSNYLKAWILQDTTMVVGIIGEGTSKELGCNWESPFADLSMPGGKMVKALAQTVAGITLVGAIQSQLIWSGNQPHALNLVLRFYALSDPKNEVMEALRALERMAAPDLNAIWPGGREPQPIHINIGRMVVYTNCVITGLSIPLDKEKHSGGGIS